MANGLLNIGNREPVSGTPAWVTLEVAHGGFATGQFLAAGPLEDFERKRLASLGREQSPTPRLQLNLSYLTEKGLQELVSMLETGCYRVRIPEQAALLFVAYLATSERMDLAYELVTTIEPWMDRLRFYPEPAESPVVAKSTVHLESVGQVSERLEKIQEHERILTQNESLNVWIPLHDEFVRLVMDSCKSPAAETAEGLGQPFVHCDSAWCLRASELLRRYAELRRVHQRSSKPERRGGVFYELRRLVDKRLGMGIEHSLPEADKVRATELLRRDFAKRGTLHSRRRVSLRQVQAQDGRLPTHAGAAKIARSRLANFDADEGLLHPDVALKPTLNEVEVVRLFNGTIEEAKSEYQFPGSIRRKVYRCLEASVDALVASGIVASGEVLARLIPQIAGKGMAEQFEDTQSQQIFSQAYQAFRNRRSLLLLDLEKQVQLEELPWVAALNQTISSSGNAATFAHKTLVEVATLNLSAFPYAIVPNKLLQEFRAFSKTAELSVNFLDELAADIFMGKFSRKFGEVTKLACEQLTGSLYARYYDIDTEILLRKDFGSGHVANGLGELCAKRAGVTLGGWSAAANGCVIEQQQILTTQNLATLFSIPDVQLKIEPKLREMAEKTFRWLTSELNTHRPDRHSQLIAIKHAAYAWRQMLFFLSHLPDDQHPSFLHWAEKIMADYTGHFPKRFHPAMVGLRNAIDGQSVDSGSANCLLGWTTSKHWMLEPS